MALRKVKAPCIVKNKDNCGVILHSPLYPQIPFRMVIIGASGSGKSTLIRNLILEPIDSVEDLEDNPLACEYYFFRYYTSSLEESSNVQNIEELDYDKLTSELDTQMQKKIESAHEGKHSIIIFDDPPTSSRIDKIIESYFTRARHINVSCIYVTHTPTRIPMKVADNSNIFIIMKGINISHKQRLSNLTNTTPDMWVDALSVKNLKYIVASNGDLTVFVDDDSVEDWSDVVNEMEI